MRAFNPKQKLAVEIVTGGTGETDHIVPYSGGGLTMVENAQNISPSANRAKGAHKIVWRRWQLEFFEKWEDRTGDFTLIAIPASGKTMAALEVARRWMAAATDRRVIIVVPTDNLRTQWQDAAKTIGMELQTKEFGTNFKDGYQGGVTTYSYVAMNSNSGLLRKLCAVAPTMVIFDEVHHCGDDLTFGKAVKIAFELCRERLSMSGTPWRTEKEPIPFVQYDGDGFAIGNYRYDYPDALSDGVVRYLIFNHAKGTIVNETTGDEAEISGDISFEEAANRLSLLLNPSGDYVEQQIREANKKLLELRETTPDAGGLAVCIDHSHAVRVAAIIHKITGQNPAIIVSEDSISNCTVEKFRNSKAPWLVAVKKVSEGTDIKRLMVLCHLTNVTTELAFRQMIGRVSRVRNEEEEGYVFLPADPRLIAAAKNIENAQVLAIQQDAERQMREAQEMLLDKKPEFTYTTTHDGTETILVGGIPVSLQDAREIERISSLVRVSQQKVLQILQLRSSAIVTEVQVQPDAPKREDEERKLRKQCHNLAIRLSILLKVEPQDIHLPYKPQRLMSIDELKAKKMKLLTEIAKYERN